MEKKVVLIQTDLVDKGLVGVEQYSRLATYVMLNEIQNARMGNNLDLTKTNPSIWLPIDTLPTVAYKDLIMYLAVSKVETDRYKCSEIHAIEVGNDDRFTDYILINYDEDKYDGLDFTRPHWMYIKHIFREVFDKEI